VDYWAIGHGTGTAERLITSPFSCVDRGFKADASFRFGEPIRRGVGVGGPGGTQWGMSAPSDPEPFVAAERALALMPMEETPAQGNEQPPPDNSRPKSIIQRVVDSFDDPNHDDISGYLDWLRAAIGDSVTDLRRTLLIMLLLIAAFEIVMESPNAHVSLGSFEIVKGSIVLIFIPMIVACLFFQMMVATTRLITLRTVFKHAFRKWSDKGGENDLDFFIYPAMPVYWNIMGASESFTNMPFSRNIESAGSVPFLLIIMFGTVAFEVQAFYLLYHVTNIFLWVIGLCIATFCIILSFAYFFASGFELSRDPV
jgi:hypothetical protein